ncbi:MAG: manganese efflux pump MntP family protein [Lachnospiraceae bacterium]
MSLFELFLLAIGLSMDAFAVAICKGLSMQQFNQKHAAIIALYFGAFQALMPAIGYLLGSRFQQSITAYDHWIAFILLALIGGNMVKESFDHETETSSPSIHFKEMLILAIATSIDALAVGVTFAFLQVSLIPAVSTIGIITFLISVLGVKVGNVFGTKYKSKAEFTGGFILILIGGKILIEHLFF